MRKVFRTRRRKVAVIAASALVVTGGAVAAFLIYTGVDGSGNGTFGGATTTSAVTITGTNQPALSPGADAGMDVNVKNNDPDALHTVNTLTGAFTSTPSECASHLSILGGGVVGTSVPAGATVVRQVIIGADATTPASCASGTWSVAFSGTTTP